MTANRLKNKEVFVRHSYIEKVEPFIDKNLIKVFIGQRRVGKSYLLYQLINHIKNKKPEAHIIYINKEDLAFDKIKNANDLNDYVLQNKSPKGKTYVFIDEIQEIQNFEKALRSLLLDDNFDLYCTGSNANMLSNDIAGQLSGRAIEIKVHSLSYLEFVDFMNLQDSADSLEKYLKYGGLPYIKHLPFNDDVIFEYLKNIYATIVFRDIINRYSIRNPQFLEQLIMFLSSNIGSMFSAKNISDFLKSQKIKSSVNQVQVYIGHFVNAFLIHKVSRYDIVGKRIFEVGEKYFFENLGIRNALWGYRLEDRGKIMENAVFNHLLVNDYDVKVGDINSREIDFVAEKQGERKYIQVALSVNDEKTIEREFGNLIKIKDNYPKFVVTMDEFKGNTMEGIKCLSLREFLTLTF